MPNTNIIQNKINEHLWLSLNRFRGSVSMESVLTFFLQLLFYKFLEDNRQGLLVSSSYKTFYFPDSIRLKNMLSEAELQELPDALAKAMSIVEENNILLLEGIFTKSDWHYLKNAYNENMAPLLYHTIKDLESFHFGIEQMRSDGIKLAEIFKHLLDNFAETQRTGFFLPPKSLRSLLGTLCCTEVKDQELILDPNCGPGVLSMDVVEHYEENGELSPIVYGQERYVPFFGIAKMLWILHCQAPENLGIGDPLLHPFLAERDRVKQFDKLVSCPPWGVNNWGAEFASRDKFKRFEWGVPPPNKGDYAYILHAIASLKDNGSAILVTSTGVLFREGTEGKIRKKIVQENVLSCIITLPPGLFNSWNVPLCILCINKPKRNEKNELLMIDLGAYPASIRDKAGLNKNAIDNVGYIFKTYRKNRALSPEFASYCRIVALEEIALNNFNISVSRYLKPQKPSSLVNREMLLKDIKSLESRIIQLDSEIELIKKQLKIS